MARTLNQQIYFCGWRHLFNRRRTDGCINDWIDHQFDRTAENGGPTAKRFSTIRAPDAGNDDGNTSAIIKFLVLAAVIVGIYVFVVKK